MHACRNRSPNLVLLREDPRLALVPPVYWRPTWRQAIEPATDFATLYWGLALWALPRNMSWRPLPKPTGGRGVARSFATRTAVSPARIARGRWAAKLIRT